jgi:translation initiation factor IF-2
MTDASKVKRLSKIARDFNVGINTIVEFLHKKGIEVDTNPNSKVPADVYAMLLKEYSTDIRVKEESEKLELGIHRGRQESVSADSGFEESKEESNQDSEPEEVIIKDLSSPKPKSHKSEVKVSEKETVKEEVISTPIDNVKVKVVGKIDLEPKKEKVEKPVPEVQKEVKKVVEKVEKPKPTPQEKPAEKVHVKQPAETKTVKKAESKPVEVETPKPTPTPAPTPASAPEEKQEIKTEIEQLEDVKVIGKIDLDTINQKTRPARKSKEEKAKERKDREKSKKQGEPGSDKDGADNKVASSDDNFIQRRVNKLSGPTVVGKIELPTEPRKPGGLSDEERKKKKRKRIKKDKVEVSNDSDNKGQRPQKGKTVQPKKGQKRPLKKEVNDEDVQKQIKDTLARLTATKGKSKGSKYRREKRDMVSQKAMEDQERIDAERNIIKVTEFVSVNELANMMDVQVTQVIATCMNLGLFVSINQRLDAETMALVADEFGYKVEFVSSEVLEAIATDEVDTEENLIPRPPIVTVMGHVDHGKTSLLDYIRKTNVISGEAGGITQHIGAYSVQLEDGRKIAFLDTPGHEAFTAMRARGAQMTDVAIVIVAADDSIMPQTVEAINHAQAAGVPIVFAINKIDKAGANPEKIKEGLANMNLLVEEWGGKYQSQDISAKQGVNIPELLDKVMLEAEMLDLKANPNRKATGTVIEATLDKGRGYVTTIMVQNGTLRIGDIMLAGNHTGHIKAMYNERNEAVTEAGPSSPVLILGLNGASQAGDKFNVMDSDRDAKEIANRRQQLAREQGLRTQKHITLDEIGRRIAIGNFQELNVIVKGDVDGSIEALSDSLIKLSTEEIQVNIKHKAVGQISESDILLAAASDAIIIGFQVRPSMAARKIAEKEEIDIRLYSVIYDAINEVKDAMEGMLSPEIKEEITSTVEVRDVFKITKVGTVAGCYVRDGKIKRSSKVRIIRDGIVVYTGDLGSLKRFKDDVKEVATGYECGLNIEKFNDIKVGDIVESYEEVEVKRTL